MGNEQLPSDRPELGTGHQHAPSPALREGTRGERLAAWFTRAGKVTVVAILAIVVVIAIYLAAAAFLPRWWAQTIGRLVDGDMGRGTLWGLFYGFLFTIAPVLVIAQAGRKRLATWKAKAIVVGIGLLLALPNWLTLWIVLGASDAAHAGERILDVDGPGFRWATLIGAVIGALIGLLIASSSSWLRRKKTKLNAREAELAAREAALTAERSPRTPPE